ncbi:MAG: hypothetical protein AAGJ81_06305 [Verrucomicrobiota bacterium]
MVPPKTKKEASLAAVLSTVLAAVVVGVVLGFVYQVRFIPTFVRTADAVASPDSDGRPTFLLGIQSPGANLNRAMRQLSDSNSEESVVSLTAGDLNEIADEYLNLTLGKQQALSNSSEPTYAILPDTPNFNLVESKLQVLVPFDILFFGMKGEGFFVSIGEFVQKDGKPSFSVEESWINSARMPAFAASFVVDRFTKAIGNMVEDSLLAKAWTNVDHIEIDGNSMAITIR